MEVFMTVISGVVVYILSQLFDEYVLHSIQEYKELRAKIAYALVYYANAYSNPHAYSANDNSIWDNASTELRKLAAETIAFVQRKSFGLWFIPRKGTLIKVHSLLIGLSNSCGISRNDMRNVDDSEEISRLLKITSARS